MPTFYRSDTRPPEVIFSEGFSRIRKLSIAELADKTVANFAVRVRGFSIDINQCNVVSMTSKFESAAIFPVGVSAGYIYAINIPVQQIPNDLLELRNNVAYDINSLEIKNAERLRSRDYCEKLKKDVADAAVVLCASEYFATLIAPEHIVCAVKFTCLSNFCGYFFDFLRCVEAGDSADSVRFLDRRFYVHPEVFNNNSGLVGRGIAVAQKADLIADYYQKVDKIFLTPLCRVKISDKFEIAKAPTISVESASFYATFILLIYNIFSYALLFKLLDYLHAQMVITSKEKTITDVNPPKTMLFARTPSLTWKCMLKNESASLLLRRANAEDQSIRRKQFSLAKSLFETASRPYAVQLHERANSSKIARPRCNSI